MISDKENWPYDTNKLIEYSKRFATSRISSSELFRQSGTFVEAQYDQVSAPATVGSHIKYCTDSKHESPKDTARVDLTSDWLQTKEKKKIQHLSWYLNKLMTDGESAEHSLPIWLTLSGTQCSSQQNTTSCVQLHRTDIHNTHSSNTDPNNRSIHCCEILSAVKVWYLSRVCASVSINVCGCMRQQQALV